jgi:diaminohydroxyphosphoribosylaminopyrimidine deaminase/5-amino-6-(5-phosphoribosylamino)uracil reductase
MKSDDTKFMLRAITVGEMGRISTAPNPWVGCVIVKDDRVLSEGYHKRKGGPHAEIAAFRNLQSIDEAHGSTLYVTLEPCCHFGSTPPCTSAILDAKVARVVIAIGSDPDENVNGGGVEILRSAGVEVVVGVCEREATASLEPYLFQRRTGRPYVVAKVGCSLNGLVAYQDGTSQWITSEASRSEAMQIRRSCQAILVGVGTVLTDNPRLTLRGSDLEDRGIIPFTRVVIDPHAKLSQQEQLNVLSDGAGPTIIFTCSEVGNLSHPQVEWIKMEAPLDLRSILLELGRRGFIQVLVEGGATTIKHFMEGGLVNRFTVFMSPSLIGSGGLPFYTRADPTSVHAPQVRFKLESVKAVTDGDGDIRIDYTV